jgi:UDP-N-acetylmuramoyl-L-alanyl-D-glutamate--2,6-diaminopimelate ligase
MLFAHLKDCKTKYASEDNCVKKVESGLKKLSLARIKKTIIVNGDDAEATYFSNFWAEEKYLYYTRKNPKKVKDFNLHQIKATDIDITNQGTSYSIEADEQSSRINLKLLGAFNVSNSLNAVAVGLAHGLTLTGIKEGLEAVTGIPGRLERIDEGQDFVVMVDYAFEPTAVEKLYETIKLIPHQRIIHVLGSAGGGRDVARRPILGKIAGQSADIVLITNEDPYDDNPQIIIDQVALGAEKAGKEKDNNLFTILDRRQAIAQALSLAQSGDAVLITGKGNEQAICVANGVKEPWDDRVVVREELVKIS